MDDEKKKGTEDLSSLIEGLSTLMKAFSHPIRLKILALCAVKRRSNRELREILGISKPLLILHLKELTKRGLLTVETEIDEDRLIVRKFYKISNFEICLNKDFFKKLGSRL